MKKLIYLTPILLLVGCDASQITQSLDIAQTGVDLASAGAAMPTPAAPILGIVSVIGNLILGIGGVALKKKHSSAKMENNAHYQGIKNVAEKIEEVAWQLKTGKVDPEKLSDNLAGLVKGTMEEAHSAYGVYKQVEDQLAKLKKKGEISKIDG